MNNNSTSAIFKHRRTFDSLEVGIRDLIKIGHQTLFAERDTCFHLLFVHSGILFSACACVCVFVYNKRNYVLFCVAVNCIDCRLCCIFFFILTSCFILIVVILTVETDVHKWMYGLQVHSILYQLCTCVCIPTAATETNTEKSGY